MTNRETIAARYRRMLVWRCRCRRLFAAGGRALTSASITMDRLFAAYFAAVGAVIGAEGRAIMAAVEREDFIRSVGAAEDQAHVNPDGWTEHGN